MQTKTANIDSHKTILGRAIKVETERERERATTTVHKQQQHLPQAADEHNQALLALSQSASDGQPDKSSANSSRAPLIGVAHHPLCTLASRQEQPGKRKIGNCTILSASPSSNSSLSAGLISCASTRLAAMSIGSLLMLNLGPGHSGIKLAQSRPAGGEKATSCSGNHRPIQDDWSLAIASQPAKCSSCGACSHHHHHREANLGRGCDGGTQTAYRYDQLLGAWQANRRPSSCGDISIRRRSRHKHSSAPVEWHSRDELGESYGGAFNALLPETDHCEPPPPPTTSKLNHSDGYRHSTGSQLGLLNNTPIELLLSLRKANSAGNLAPPANHHRRRRRRHHRHSHRHPHPHHHHHHPHHHHHHHPHHQYRSNHHNHHNQINYDTKILSPLSSNSSDTSRNQFRASRAPASAAKRADSSVGANGCARQQVNSSSQILLADTQAIASDHRAHKSIQARRAQLQESSKSQLINNAISDHNIRRSLASSERKRNSCNASLSGYDSSASNSSQSFSFSFSFSSPSTPTTTSSITSLSPSSSSSSSSPLRNNSSRDFLAHKLQIWPAKLELARDNCAKTLSAKSTNTNERERSRSLPELLALEANPTLSNNHFQAQIIGPLASKRHRFNRPSSREQQDEQQVALASETNILSSPENLKLEAKTGIAKCPYEVMDIHHHRFQQQHRLFQESFVDRISAPKTYPNNTLIADLSECHLNIASFWPKTAQRTTKNALRTLSTCKRKLFSCSKTTEEVEVGQQQQPNNLNTSERLEAIEDPEAAIDNCKCLQVKNQFRFQMPEALMRTNTKLKLDDYNRALSVLTGDVRYQLHLLLYRHVQTIWLLLSTVLCFLAPVLIAAPLEALAIVSACLGWLTLQLIGAFAAAKFRKKLDRMLERSVAQVNGFFMDHNLLLGVINVGSLISRAKLTIPILYFDTSPCREQIESIISIDSRKDAANDNTEHNKLILDYSKIDLPSTRPNTVAFAQSLAKKIVLRYSQRWISYFDKRKLMFTDDQIKPRHLSTGKCLCQFVEEHFRNTSIKTKITPESKTLASQHNQPAIIATRPLSLSGQNDAALISANQRPLSRSGDDGKLAPGNCRPQSRLVADRQQETIVRPTDQPHIPTLSRLVSLNEPRAEQRLQFRVNMDRPGLGPDGLIANQSSADHKNSVFIDNLSSWHQHYQRQKEYANSFRSSPIASQQRHTKTPSDVSIDINPTDDQFSIGRSDDLIKKLRLFLELRKDELQGVDTSSLFSGVLYKASQAAALADCSDQNEAHQAIPVSQQDSPDDRLSRPVKVNGDKLYGQRQGFFFLGLNGTKKSQQRQQRTQEANANQVLEIC